MYSYDQLSACSTHELYLVIFHFMGYDASWLTNRICETKNRLSSTQQIVERQGLWGVRAYLVCHAKADPIKKAEFFCLFLLDTLPLIGSFRYKYYMPLSGFLSMNTISSRKHSSSQQLPTARISTGVIQERDESVIRDKDM